MVLILTIVLVAVPANHFIYMCFFLIAVMDAGPPTEVVVVMARGFVITSILWGQVQRCAQPCLHFFLFLLLLLLLLFPLLSNTFPNFPTLSCVW